MPSTYSPLKIELPATGEQSGTWGNTTNTNLGTALEEAITGSANVTFASGNVVLTLTDTNASQVARNLRLNLIGVTGGSTRTLTVPAIKKLYLVSNNCADSVIVGNSTGATVTVPAGNNIFIYNDGTDVLNAITYITALNAATVSAGSVTTTQVDIVSQGDLRLQDTTGGQYVALQAPGTIASSYTLTLPVDDGTDGQALITDGNGVLSWSTAASGDVYGPASATDNAIARFDLTTGKIIQNSAVTIADTTGSLNFTAAGARITGDFSAGTVANRLSFQSSTVNGVTAIPVLPNGTATTARHDYFNNSDPANAGFGRIEINTTAFAFQAGLTGTGSFLPITFLTSNTERLRIDTVGNVGIGTATPTTRLDIIGNTGSVTAPAYLNQTSISLRNNFHARVALVNADATIYESAISSYGAGASFPTQTLSFAPGPALVYVNGTGSAAPTEKFRIDSTGRVGIGLSSPSSTVSILASGTNNPFLFSSNTNGTSYPAAILGGSFDNNFSGGAGEVGIWNCFTTAATSFVFRQLTGASSATTLMVIKPNGYVALGGGDPASFLTIAGGTLSSTAASVIPYLNTTFTTGNGLNLQRSAIRTSTGSSWETAGYREQATVDATFQSWMQYNGTTSGVPCIAWGAGGAATALGVPEIMRLNSIGLGIGNTSPAALLDVGSTSLSFVSSLIRASTTGTSELRFADTTNNAGYIAYDHTGDSMRFGTATTERMRITSVGHVGINTSAPFGIFHVKNSTNQNLFITNGSGYGGASGISLVSVNDANSAYEQLVLAGSAIVLNAAGGSGNVGIGTSSPSQKLSVIGSIISSQSITIGSDGLFAAGSIYSDSNWGMLFRAKQASPGQADFAWQNAGGTERMRIDSTGNVLTGGLTSAPAQADPNSTAGQIVALNTKRELRWASTNASIYGGSGGLDDNLYYHSGLSHVFRTGNTERVRITASGSVGIGTTGIGGQLDVIGLTQCRSDLNSGTSTPLKLINDGTTGTVSTKLAFQNGGVVKASINAAVFNNDFMTFNVGSDTERMRINSGGNLLVGTSNPPFQTVSTAGSIVAVGSINSFSGDIGNTTTGNSYTMFTAVRGASYIVNINAANTCSVYLVTCELSSSVVTNTGLLIQNGANVTNSGTTIRFTNNFGNNLNGVTWSAIRLL
jgi:hypothetical protein